MAFLGSMDISASALTAQRFRMDVVAENLANMSTTRTAEGTPYRRRMVIMQERSFEGVLQAQMNTDAASRAGGTGVRVASVVEDQAPFKLEYKPEHPDANEDGYVEMPNVDLNVEMVDMLSATRSYEANITAINAVKNMAMSALDIGK